MSDVLEGFLTPDRFAKAIKRSRRTVDRMIARREVVYTHLGRVPLIDLVGTRELLRARAAKAQAKRKSSPLK